MTTLKRSSGSRSRARYKDENRASRHQEVRVARLERRLAQKKAWRIAKYQNVPQAQLSSTTKDLFREWGIPLIGPRTAPKPAPVVRTRWGWAK